MGKEEYFVLCMWRTNGVGCGDFCVICGKGRIEMSVEPAFCLIEPLYVMICFMFQVRRVFCRFLST